MVKQHLSMIDKWFLRLHHMAIPFHKTARNMDGITIKIARARNFLYSTQPEPFEKSAVYMHKPTPLIFDKKTDIREMLEKVGKGDSKGSIKEVEDIIP